MATNYNGQCVLYCGGVTSGGVTDGLQHAVIPVSSSFNYLITALVVVVHTAGDAAGHKVRLRTYEASPTTIAEVTVGTSAAKTQLSAVVDESLVLRTAAAASSLLEVVSITASNNVKFYFSVWGTPAHV